jgi:hypothetical protein
MTKRFSHGWHNHGDKRRKGVSYGTLNSTSDIDGEVLFGEAFDALDYVAKIDLLRDWIGLLEMEIEFQQEADAAKAGLLALDA